MSPLTRASRAKIFIFSVFFLEKKKVYQPYLKIFETRLKEDNNTFASHDTFHSIKAIKNSVSLHIYSPPLYYEDKN